MLPSRAVQVTGPKEGQLTARVLRSLFRGNAHVVTIELPGGHRLQIPWPRRLAPASVIGLSVQVKDLRWF